MKIRGQCHCADCGKPAMMNHTCPEGRLNHQIRQLEATVADLRKKIDALMFPEIYPESLGTVYFMTKFGLAVYPLESEVRIIPKGYALTFPANGPASMDKIGIAVDRKPPAP